MAEQGTDSATIADLHRAGWSVGVVALASLDGSGRVVWQVDGRNGENVIRSAGATEAEACEQIVGEIGHRPGNPFRAILLHPALPR
jgi:hypothetical protein